jgi:peroxiredoxin
MEMESPGVYGITVVEVGRVSVMFALPDAQEAVNAVLLVADDTYPPSSITFPV